MKILSQDTIVVNALKCILEDKDYDHLEYDESKSRNEDYLHVEVIREKPDRHVSEINEIQVALERETGVQFRPPIRVGIGTQNFDASWVSFRIRENKLP